jgi:hypothetical protein
MFRRQELNMANIKRRRVLNAIIAGLGVPFIGACGGDNQDDPAPGGGSPIELDEYLVYWEKADPRIVGGLLEDGTSFVMSGTKDSNGKILDAYTFNFLETDGNITAVQYDPARDRVTSNIEGGQLSLSFPSSGGINIGLTSGGKQLETNIPMPGGTALSQQAQPPTLVSSLERVPGASLKLTAAPESCGACTRLLASGVRGTRSLSSHTQQFAPIAKVTLTGCPSADAKIFVYMRDETGKILEYPEARRVGENEYEAVLKNINTADEAYVEAAKALHEFLDHYDLTGGVFWNIYSHVKNKSMDEIIEGYLDYLKNQDKFADTYEEMAPFTGAEPEDIEEVRKRAKFRKALEKVLRPIKKTVDIVDKLLAAAKFGDLVGKSLDAYGQSKYNRLQLQAVVKTGNGGKFLGGGSGLIPPEGPYPPLTVDVPGLANISEIVISPARPIHGENYRAQCSIDCLLRGDVITASVEGSDDYSGSVSTTVETAGRQAVIIEVPGAQEGVRDLITIKVERAGSFITDRTASIVFA